MGSLEIATKKAESAIALSSMGVIFASQLARCLRDGLYTKEQRQETILQYRKAHKTLKEAVGRVEEIAAELARTSNDVVP